MLDFLGLRAHFLFKCRLSYPSALSQCQSGNSYWGKVTRGRIEASMSNCGLDFLRWIPESLIALLDTGILGVLVNKAQTRL
jgi:hypothetical protein